MIIIGHSVRPRGIEWLMACYMAAYGAILALPGNTFSLSSTYDVLARHGTEMAWAGILVGVALARMAALRINGRMPRGSPLLRCATALLGSALWAAMTYAFAVSSTRNGAWSIGVAVGVLAAGDMWAAIRAGRDAGQGWSRRSGEVRLGSS